MPRGVKPKAKAEPRAPLAQKVPAGMKGEAAKCYRALAKELAIEGYACQADWRLVALTATTLARHDKLRDAVDRMESLDSCSPDLLKQERAELKVVASQLASLYAQLLLTPRSRSASRMTEAQARTAATRSDELGDFLSE